MLRPRITNFPLGINGHESYDIVYFGNIVKSSCNLAKKLRDNYVFLFSTYLNHLKKDNSDYGAVQIHLVRDIELSFFNPDLQGISKHHVYEGGNIILNEFLEIQQLENDIETVYIVNLKDQTFYKDYKPDFKQDMRVFLFSESKRSEGGCDNLPAIRLAPEFEAKLKVDDYEEIYDYYSKGYEYLRHLEGQIEDEEDRRVLNKVIQSAKEKEDESARKKEEIYNEYTNKLIQCNYYDRTIK